MSLLLLVAVTGCSAMTMPSARAVTTKHVPCTTGRAAPATDTFVAVIGGMVAFVGIAAIVRAKVGDYNYSDGDTIAAIETLLGAGAAVSGGLTLLAFGSSARHGSRSADACGARYGVR